MKSLALVIGNADYSAEKDKLLNAANDAEDITIALSKLSFKTILVKNCTAQEFDRSVQEYTTSLKDYDVGLFYFSGHGLQIDGVNYLTSIDTSFVDSVSAKHTSYSLDQLIERIQQASPLINILILDACRDNPLPTGYRGVNKGGLAPIHAPKGTIIAFSTSPGEKAMDYGSGRNSIYTGSLLSHINDPNVPIEEYFKRVRTSVHTISKGRQTSWEHTSLIGSYTLNHGQQIYSTSLPYKLEAIEDSRLASSGSEIDEIIAALKTYNFYKQEPAVNRISSLNVKSADKNALFVLGRNLLQTADGGERSAYYIFETLSNALKHFTDDKGENHVLNGILYEIYFDSKGKFRQSNLKSSLINEVYKLENNVHFKSSFAFISQQLKPFHSEILYIPEIPIKAIPIEIGFEKNSNDTPFGEHIYYRVLSIKHEEVELLSADDDYGYYSISYEDFKNRLSILLGIPVERMRISANYSEEEIDEISLPTSFTIGKQQSIKVEKPSLDELLSL